jgi:hypothetical protein
MKIQQMAFMLVAVMIFFGMVAVIYFSISLSSLESKVEQLREEEARELARQITGTPEFTFTAAGDCSSCLDMDKAFQLKEKGGYENLWNLNYLEIERIHPNSPALVGERECDTATQYRDGDCNKIIIINRDGKKDTKIAFVTLVRWNSTIAGATNWKYELGRIHASPTPID